MAEKTATAVELLRTWEKTAVECEPEYGFWGCESGGVRSAVMRQLCVLADVKVRWHYNPTSVDPPEVCHFIRDEYPDTVWDERPPGFLDAALEQGGVMARRGSWCWREFKSWGGEGKLKLISARWEESKRFRLLWKKMMVYDPMVWRGSAAVGCWMWNPLVGWSVNDIWEFVRRGTVACCCLHDGGQKHVGCIGCPMRGRAALQRDFERWPGMADAWAGAFDRAWARKRAFNVQRGPAKGLQWPGIQGIERWEELFEWWRKVAGPKGSHGRCGSGRFCG